MHVSEPNHGLYFHTHDVDTGKKDGVLVPFATVESVIKEHHSSDLDILSAGRLVRFLFVCLVLLWSAR